MFYEADVHGEDVCVVSPDGERIVFHDEWKPDAIAVCRVPVPLLGLNMPLYPFVEPAAIVASQMITDDAAGPVALGGLTKTKVANAMMEAGIPEGVWKIATSEPEGES